MLFVYTEVCHFAAAVLFQAKNDPFKKEPTKNDADDKASSSKAADKRTTAGIKTPNKWVTYKTQNESYVY